MLVHAHSKLDLWRQPLRLVVRARPRTAAGEVTSDDVADCIQREWAAARALDAERDATTGRGVDVRAREAVGRRDAGGAGSELVVSW